MLGVNARLYVIVEGEGDAGKAIHKPQAEAHGFKCVARKPPLLTWIQLCDGLCNEGGVLGVEAEGRVCRNAKLPCVSSCTHAFRDAVSCPELRT